MLNLTLFLLLQSSLPMIEENSVVHDEIVTTEITTTTTTIAQPVSEHKALDIAIAIGALNSLGSQDSYSLFPTALIEVYAQTAEYKYTPDLVVKVNLSSLPEEEISLNDSSSFKSLKFEAGIRQGIPGVYAKVYGGFGIETRLPGETGPRVNAAKYFTAGIYFTTENNSSYIYVGGGPDQRLDLEGRYLATAHIEGMVKLYNYKDAKLSLKGDAILGGQSSLVRVGIVVGI